MSGTIVTRWIEDFARCVASDGTLAYGPNADELDILAARLENFPAQYEELATTLGSVVEAVREAVE